MDLAFSLRTYDGRISRVSKRMAASRLDALIVSAPDNLHYLTGFDGLGYLWFQALLLGPGLAAPTLITRTTEEACVWQTSCVRHARFYDIAKADPVKLAASVLAEAGAGDGRIGVELSAFTLLPQHWDRLRTLMPEAKFVDASTLVAEERLIKSAEEIAYQRAAAQMADHALTRGLEALRPGIAEVEVAGVLARALGEAGSEHAAISPMVASGPRSAMIHAMPGQRSLALGDVVCLELAGVCRRYHAVVMRTAVLGRASDRVREVAACLNEGFDAAIGAARAGAAAGAPDRACNARLERLDLVRRRAHRIGYSLGIAYAPTWLEAMLLDDADSHRLAEGMSFTVEPNLSLADEGFGIKLGDTVACTRAGGESLSGLDRHLIVID